MTAVDSLTSDTLNIVREVPQGSVLGPLLFDLYVNDVYTSSLKFKFYLFADDTNMSRPLDVIILVSLRPCLHIVEAMTFSKMMQ